jgi:hypothetical protein
MPSRFLIPSSPDLFPWTGLRPRPAHSASSFPKNRVRSVFASGEEHGHPPRPRYEYRVTKAVSSASSGREHRSVRVSLFQVFL